MKILGIETSCDETSIAIVEKDTDKEHVELIVNLTSTSLPLHAKTGGIIPEIAAREQLRDILPLLDKVLEQTSIKDLDAIAVTVGPGLIGSLLVGVETAKTLSYVWDKPIIPVNHLIGHIYANWLMADSKWQIEKPYAISHRPSAEIMFPALALIVSGGHTDLLLIKKHGTWQWLGGTRDDAAGEAFDKIGRLLGFPYPAGPTISKLAEKGDPKRFNLPRPMIHSNDFDFSFSGLKTAAMNTVILNSFQDLGSNEIPKSPKRTSLSGDGAVRNDKLLSDFCASVEQAIVDVLVKKTLQAAQKHNVKSIVLGGGVAANEKLRNELKLNAKRYGLNAEVFVPQKSLCTDNAAMIAAAAFYNSESVPWQEITANPELYFDN